MENQTLTEILNALKEARYIYNDADFCRKTGLKPSFVSEMKAGKKPFTGATRTKIEETFPDFFAARTVVMKPDQPTLGEVYQSLSDHEAMYFATLNRILDGMGVAAPAPKKAASS